MRTDVVTKLNQMATEWAAFSRQLRERAGANEAAAAYASAATDLRAVAEELDDQLDASLTVADASRECGYSERQLRRMIAEGRLDNVGRRYAPRLRRRDLPQKPVGLTAGKPWGHAKSYDDFGRIARIAPQGGR